MTCFTAGLIDIFRATHPGSVHWLCCRLWRQNVFTLWPTDIQVEGNLGGWHSDEWDLYFYLAQQKSDWLIVHFKCKTDMYNWQHLQSEGQVWKGLVTSKCLCMCKMKTGNERSEECCLSRCCTALSKRSQNYVNSSTLKQRQSVSCGLLISSLWHLRPKLLQDKWKRNRLATSFL